jgi:transposase
VEKTTVISKVSPEHHRKEDMFDAKMLAEYADRFTDRLHIQQPPQQAIGLLRQLYGERRRLVRQQTATLTKQTQSAQQPHCCELLHEGWTEQLSLLKKQIKALEERIEQIITSHKGLKAYYKLLMDIPGVGQVTATLWLMLFYGQEKLNPKKIASRFGFAPHNSRSGSSVRGKTRSSGHGHSEMRGNMALAVRSASTHYRQFKEYKEKKLAEGKCWGIVRNNMINKLIKIICAIWNSRQPYDPGHISRFNRQKNAA